MEDCFYGDNKNNTGWTLERINLYAEHLEEKSSKDGTEIAPEGFIRKKQPFKWEWIERK